jgi:predicted nucleic acid-binding protein
LSLLADTSAIIAARRGSPETRARLDELVDDELWICDVVRLELLRGADSARHVTTLRASMEDVRSAPIDDRAWRRAEEIYEGLARLRGGGRHRGVQPTDVLIAAAAEARDLPVLHADSDFELIARVTGQQLIRLP